MVGAINGPATRPRLADFPDSLTVEQVADVLGLARSTMYDAVKRGDVPSFWVGRRRFVGRAALERLLAGLPQEETP